MAGGDLPGCVAKHGDLVRGVVCDALGGTGRHLPGCVAKHGDLVGTVVQPHDVSRLEALQFLDHEELAGPAVKHLEVG